jgi:hypothetical protein
MSTVGARALFVAATVVVLVAGGVGPGVAVASGGVTDTGGVGVASGGVTASVGPGVTVASGAVTATVGAGPRAGSTGAPGAAAQRNGTAGGIVAGSVDTQGDSLGRPLSSPDTTFDGAFYGRVTSFAEAYNERQPDLGAAGDFARGEVVNLHVVAPGGEEGVVSFHLTDDNRIRNLRAGPREDATIRIEMEKATFDRIATADDPGAAFERNLEDGEISVTRRGALSGPIESLVDVITDLIG